MLTERAALKSVIGVENQWSRSSERGVWVLRGEGKEEGPRTWEQ